MAQVLTLTTTGKKAGFICTGCHYWITIGSVTVSLNPPPGWDFGGWYCGYCLRQGAERAGALVVSILSETVEPPTQIIGREILRKFREQQSLTLRKLSEWSGLAASTLNAYELGHRHPSRKALRKLLTPLGLDPGEARSLFLAFGYKFEIMEDSDNARW